MDIDDFIRGGLVPKVEVSTDKMAGVVKSIKQGDGGDFTFLGGVACYRGYPLYGNPDLEGECMRVVEQDSKVFKEGTFEELVRGLKGDRISC